MSRRLRDCDTSINEMPDFHAFADSDFNSLCKCGAKTLAVALKEAKGNGTIGAVNEELIDAVNDVLKTYVDDGKRPCGVFVNPDTRKRLSDELTHHYFYNLMEPQRDTGGIISRWTSPFGNINLLEDRYMNKDEIAVVEIVEGFMSFTPSIVMNFSPMWRGTNAGRSSVLCGFSVRCFI